VRSLPPALPLLLAVAALSGCGGGSDDGGSAGGGSAEPASLEEVQGIVEQRCVPCHSPKPTIDGYEQSGLIDFSDPKNIELHREVINTVVVVQKRMPFNNETKMTQEERDRIASWAKSG
jgi:uncharacterized membrane protein